MLKICVLGKLRVWRNEEESVKVHRGLSREIKECHRIIQLIRKLGERVIRNNVGGHFRTFKESRGREKTTELENVFLETLGKIYPLLEIGKKRN